MSGLRYLASGGDVEEQDQSETGTGQLASAKPATKPIVDPRVAHVASLSKEEYEAEKGKAAQERALYQIQLDSLRPGGGAPGWNETFASWRALAAAPDNPNAQKYYEGVQAANQRQRDLLNQKLAQSTEFSRNVEAQRRFDELSSSDNPALKEKALRLFPQQVEAINSATAKGQFTLKPGERRLDARGNPIGANAALNGAPDLTEQTQNNMRAEVGRSGKPTFREFNGFRYTMDTTGRLTAVPIGSNAPVAAPASAPTGAGGNAVEIATRIGAPIISGNRTTQQQAALAANPTAPGINKAGIVAPPGHSPHEKGNAIDVDESKMTPEIAQALRDNGFVQSTQPGHTNHWELRPTGGAPAQAAAQGQGASTDWTTHSANVPTKPQSNVPIDKQYEADEAAIKRADDANKKQNEAFVARKAPLETSIVAAEGILGSLQTDQNLRNVIKYFSEPSNTNMVNALLKQGVHAGNFRIGIDLQDARLNKLSQQEKAAAETYLKSLAMLTNAELKKAYFPGLRTTNYIGALEAALAPGISTTPEALEARVAQIRAAAIADARLADDWATWSAKYPWGTWAQFTATPHYKQIYGVGGVMEKQIVEAGRTKYGRPS